MAKVRHALFSARWGVVLQTAYLVFWVASLGLGYFGLHEYCVALNRLSPRTIGDQPTDIAYYDLELILIQFTPMGSPLPSGHAPPPVPVALQIARFAVPTIVAFSFAKVRLALSAHRLLRARLRNSREHAIVCGSTRAADVLARRLRAGGTTVVRIDPDGRSSARYAIKGNPASRQTLMEAGITRASRLYACLEHGSENAEVAHAAERIWADRARPERIYALIDDLELCTSLRARRWSMGTGAPHVDFFNPDELAAQTVVRRDAAAFGQGPPEIAIAGTGAFGRSVLVEFARQWIVRRRTPGERMRALLIGPDAFETAALLRERYAFLGDACEIAPTADTVESVLARRRRGAAPRLRRLYLCQDNEDDALKAALDLAAHLRSTLTAVVVRLERLSGLAEAFHRDRGGLLDALGGRLLFVDAMGEGCDPARVDDDLGEELARACHQNYVTECLELGAEFGNSSSMVPWEGLNDELWVANRAQAADIGRKLREIGCLVAPRSAVESEFVYREEEVEHLARQEHGRWSAEQREHGWVYAPVRNDDARQHPSLLAWRDLTEEEWEKDREAVRVSRPCSRTPASSSCGSSRLRMTTSTGTTTTGGAATAVGPGRPEPRPDWRVGPAPGAIDAIGVMNHAAESEGPRRAPSGQITVTGMLRQRAAPTV